MVTLNASVVDGNRDSLMNYSIPADTTGNSVDWGKRRESVPHLVKYMGAKRQILDFVIDGIKEVHTGGQLCDLFAGTAVLSGALASVMPIHSNDMQAYSKVMAELYLSSKPIVDNGTLDRVLTDSQKQYTKLASACGSELVDHHLSLPREEYLKIESQHRDFLHKEFGEVGSHLFTKNYSGTYWSVDQCMWIDSIVEASNRFKNQPIYNQILASLMYAMSYSAQSTGHFAQYRDAATEESFIDILKYRRKNILFLFQSKFNELLLMTPSKINNHKATTMDYKDCLAVIPKGGTVYADPPYGAVHYSRFYHALETLVKYDYPQVQFKGRYRQDRHQSPFCTTTKVKPAFQAILTGVKNKRANLVLSYSDNGMISLDNLLLLCKSELKLTHNITCRDIDYNHSTMGRSEDKGRKVKEYLILASIK
ncbi:DNA adenine methylase [Hymenobacter sp. NST-14]|uniref:DNA adenine methylase n=1 Tax=Hymenobacter piscis TaxID=2839984 RepID=UPI001C01BE95|nr:DNA adenine methylase [Hymenobacter piscis]MBT9395346.1 DNA adenine methylase [Hymenobacter piscis]